MHVPDSDRCMSDGTCVTQGNNEPPMDAVQVTEFTNLMKKVNRTSAKDDAKSIERIERALLKKLQTSLTGIPPPPSVTDCRIDASQILTQYKQNEDRLSHHTDEVVEKKFAECLSKPTHSVQDVHKLQWPDLLKVRAHGLSYNHSSVTEDIEMLGLTFVDRFIGSETSSTFNAPQSPSNANKRILRRKLLNESLASRVSHLTHRRSVFSLDNLRNGAINSNSNATGTSKKLESCNIIRSVDKENDEKSIQSGKLPRKDSFKEEQPKLQSLNNSKIVFSSSISQPVTTLTEENQKKKLLWAVTQALEAKQISVKHENFKQFATNLAQVVKRLFTEFDDHSVSSTSEKLLRLANKHVLEVIQGHNGDDICIKEETRNMNARNIDDELSKNSILRKNIDIELRQNLSQQRMAFCGKDQQNIMRR